MKRFANLKRIAPVAVLALLGSIGPALADYVGNLNPNGDNYLSLRQYANSKSREISRMGPGTILEILDADGPWRYVQTQDGRIGWAHSSYILPGLPGGNYTPPPPPPVGGYADEAGDVPMEDYQAPVAPPVVAAAPDEYDWLEGHLTQFHDPLKYYP